MVTLSELIKKSKEKKSPEKKISISEAVQVTPDKEKQRQQEIEEIYASAILRLKQIMDEIVLGRTKEWKEIVQIVENIVGEFIIKPEIFLSLVNNFILREITEDYLYPHSVNVSIFAANLGFALGYNKSEVIDLCACSLIHDIGMLKISKQIIDKPSKLSEEEFTEIKRHPVYGLAFLLKIKDSPKITADVVYQHHENKDGTGYPEGKKGDEISEFAKIVAIAEVFEAMTHPRPYRTERIIPFAAVKIIIQEDEAKFDQKVLKAFLNYITFYPINSFVMLNNNEIGRVIGINNFSPMRPIVEIVFDGQGNQLKKLKIIDLAKSPVLFIKKAIDEQSLREAL
jgi:HD-GYP domain-containing protein (c-di-GMP phosphodiesterase class II)